MNTPIKVDLTRQNECCIPTTFWGMNTPRGFTSTLLQLKEVDGKGGEFMVAILMFDGTKYIGGYIINLQHVKFPSGLELEIVIKTETLVADNANHLRTTALAELLASNSTLTISRDNGVTTVRIHSELLNLDIREDVPAMYLPNFIPLSRQ